MTLKRSEKKLVFVYGPRIVEAWITGTLFLPVSPTRADVLWRFTANLIACFCKDVLTAGGDVFLTFPWLLPGRFDLYSWTIFTAF